MWLDPVRSALDGRAQPTWFFFRDDDAGWNDQALWQLLDVFDDYAVAVDLAVIPEALGVSAAQVLDARRAAAPHLLGLHQHGSRHENHQRSGRKCEFGDARTHAEQFDDLSRGQRRLHTLLGAIDPIFTPPWNRCTTTTVDCLKSLGFEMLSRDAGARPHQSALLDLPVHIDWCKHSEVARARWQPLGERIAHTITANHTVGLMLHHAVMSAIDHVRLASLLHALRTHPQARFARMRDFIPAIQAVQKTTIDMIT